MVAPTPNPMTVEQWNADPANAGYRMYIGEDGNTYVEYVGQTADWQQAGPSPQQLATASTTGTPTDTYGGVVTQSSGTTPAMSEGPRTPEAKQALDSVANTSFSSSDTQGAEADPNLLTRYSFFDEIGNRIAGEDGFNVGDLNPLNIAQAGLIGLGEGLDKGRRRTVEALGEQAYNKMTGQETDRGFLGTIAAPSLWAYEQLNKINLSKQTENQIGDGGGFSDWLADPKNEAQVKRLYENGYNGYEGGDALWEYFISDKSNAQKMALDVMNDPLLWITAGTATAAQRSVQLGAKATQGLTKLGVAPAVAETIGSGVETAARKLPYVADPTEVLFPAIGKVAQKTGLASQIGKVTSNPAVQRLNPFRETETSRLRSEVSNAEDLMQNLGRQLDDPSVRPPQTPAQPMRLVDDPDVEGDLALFDPNTDSIIKLDAAGLQALDENLRNLSFDDYRTLLNDASGNSQGAKLSSMLFGMSMPPGMVQWFETTNWQQKPQAFERYVNMIIARLDRTASPIEQQNFIDSLYNDALNIARGRRAIGGVPANIQNRKYQAAARMDTIDVILAKGGFVDQNATQHARLARQLRGEGAAHGYVRPQAPRARQVPPPGGNNPPPPGLFGNTPPPPPPPPGGGGAGLYPPPTTPPPPPPGLSGGMPPRPNAPQPGGGLYPGSRPTPPPQTPNVPDAEIPPPPNMPGTTPEPPAPASAAPDPSTSGRGQLTEDFNNGETLQSMAERAGRPNEIPALIRELQNLGYDVHLSTSVTPREVPDGSHIFFRNARERAAWRRAQPTDPIHSLTIRATKPGTNNQLPAVELEISNHGNLAEGFGYEVRFIEPRVDSSGRPWTQSHSTTLAGPEMAFESIRRDVMYHVEKTLSQNADNVAPDSGIARQATSSPEPPAVTPDLTPTAAAPEPPAPVSSATRGALSESYQHGETLDSMVQKSGFTGVPALIERLLNLGYNVQVGTQIKDREWLGGPYWSRAQREAEEAFNASRGQEHQLTLFVTQPNGNHVPPGIELKIFNPLSTTEPFDLHVLKREYRVQGRSRILDTRTVSRFEGDAPDAFQAASDSFLQEVQNLLGRNAPASERAPRARGELVEQGSNHAQPLNVDDIAAATGFDIRGYVESLLQRGYKVHLDAYVQEAGDPTPAAGSRRKKWNPAGNLREGSHVVRLTIFNANPDSPVRLVAMAINDRHTPGAYDVGVVGKNTSLSLNASANSLQTVFDGIATKRSRWNDATKAMDEYVDRYFDVPEPATPPASAGPELPEPNVTPPASASPDLPSVQDEQWVGQSLGAPSQEQDNGMAYLRWFLEFTDRNNPNYAQNMEALRTHQRQRDILDAAGNTNRTNADVPVEDVARQADTPQQSRTPYTGVLREPTDETVTVPLGFGGELEFEPWQAGSARPIFIETPFGPITRVVLTNFQGQRVVVPMGIAQRFDDGGVEAQSWVPISAIRPDGIDYALIDEDMAPLMNELAAKIDNIWFSEKYEPESLAAQWEVEPDRVATILDSMIFANAMAPGARRPNMRSVFREEFMGRAQTNADAPVENVARQAETPEPTVAPEPTDAPEPPAPSQSLADQGWEIEQITTEMDGGMPTWSVRPPGTDRQYFLVRATQQDGSVRWEAYNAQTGQSRIIGGNDLSPEQAQRRLAEAIGQPGQAVPTEPRPQAPQRPPYREGQPITEAGFTVELGTRVGFNNMFRGHQLVEPFVVTAPDGRKYWMIARAEQPPGGQRDGVIFQGDPNQRQWRIYRADPATGRITRDQVLPRGSRSVTRARAELLIYEDVFGPLPRRPTQLPPLPGRRRRGSGGGTTPPNNTNRGGGGGGGGGTPPPPPRNGGYGGFEWADDRPGLPDPMRTWKTDVIFTDEDMAVLERVVDGEQLGQFVLNAKSEIQLAKQLLASGETVDTSPVLASFMKRYGPDGMGVIKEIDDITKITPEVENIIAAGLGRKKLEVAVGLRNAKGEIPIRPFMGSMKLGRALDTYDRISNALKGSQLYNWANILPFTVKQVVGNSVTLGLANPRSLREFFSPANWRAIYRREREGLLGATESSIDKLRSSYGLPPSNRIRQSTRQGSLAGAKLLGKENARTPIGELLAPDKLRDFGQVADNAMREAVYGTTARPMLADLKQRIRVHAQKRANDFGVQVDEDQLTRLFDELERANDGGFSPVQLRTALRESGFAGDRLDDWAERVARDFLGGKVDDPATGFNGLRQIDQLANAEMERVGFRFEERNIDAVMNRLTFYHYWNSRAGLLYGQELLRKPLLAVSYYRAMEGLKNEAEQNNYPEWLNGWIQMMGTPAGFTTYLNPISTFGTMLTFAEAQFRESGNTISDLTAIGRFVDRSPFQVNPLLASMLYWSGALGSDAAMPNIGGGFTTINRDAVELVNLFRTNVQGKPPLSANFNITPALSNRIANWTTTLMANSGLDTNIVERRNLNAGQITNKNWFVQQILQEDDPTLTDEEAALVAAQIQDDLDNPIVKEAMARAAEIPFQGIFSTQPFSEGGFGGLVGGFLNTQISPITAVTRPTLKNENQAIRQADREGKPVSPVALNTAYLQNDVATMANQDDFRFEQTVDGYNAIGTDQQRAAKTLWDNITSGAVTGPVTANGVTYTPEQILGMSEDRRKDVARVALDDQGLMTELQRYWDTTAQYRAAHPELTDYWAFKDTAELYPGGVEQFAQAAMQRNEGYARYVRDQERIFPELKVPGSDRNKMLTSDDAYRSAMGIPKSIYETAQAGQGTGPYGPSIPGVAAGLTPGQQQAQTKGGAESQPSDYEESVKKDIDNFSGMVALMNEYDAKMGYAEGTSVNQYINRVLNGKSGGKLDSAIYSAIDDAYGYVFPSKATLKNYLIWLLDPNANPDGSSDIQRFLDWNSVQLAREALGKPDVAGGEGGDLTRNALIGNQVVVRAADGSGYSFVPADQTGTGQVVQDRPRVTPISTMLLLDPQNPYQTLGPVPPGLPLYLISREGDWALVETPDGVQGWVQVSGIANAA